MEFVEYKSFVEYKNVQQHNTDIDSQIKNATVKLYDGLVERIIECSIFKYEWNESPDYKFHISIKKVGYFVIPDVYKDPDDYVYGKETGPALHKAICEKLQSLDIDLLSKVCEEYSDLDNRFDKECDKLKDLFCKKYLAENKQLVEKNKQLKEQVKQLSCDLEDFMNLANDVDALNSQKIEKQ